MIKKLSFFRIKESYFIFELSFLRLFSWNSALLFIWFVNVELSLFELIFHIDWDECFNTVLLIFLFFLKVVIIGFQHNRTKYKDNSKELLNINRMTKVDDINNNSKTLSDTNNKSRNMLFIEFNHFVNDNLSQCIQNRQYSNIHNDLFMSWEEFIKVKNLSSYSRKGHRNEKSVFVYL